MTEVVHGFRDDVMRFMFGELVEIKKINVFPVAASSLLSFISAMAHVPSRGSLVFFAASAGGFGMPRHA